MDTANIDPEKLDSALNISKLVHVVEERGLELNLLEDGKTLSGGQLQRVSIARVLYHANSNNILLLDEPTSALDQKTSAAIIKGLTRFSPDMTIICAVHDKNLLKYFDKFAEIKEGKIVNVVVSHED